MIERTRIRRPSAKDFLYGDLTEGIDVLLENVRFLVGTLGREGRIALADYLKLDQGTISRWNSGKNRPDPENLEKLAQYFCIANGIGLAKMPIFLEMGSAIDRERRLLG